MPMLKGSCLCGKVRYEVRGDPQAMYYCHCQTCRKANGSSFATNMIVTADDFAVVAGGELLSAFESSANKHRHFCSKWGSPIYSHAEKTRHVVSVRCGTLDTEPSVRPSIHFYVADKAGWMEICDGLPQVAESLS
jgi:hypothetical protein